MVFTFYNSQPILASTVVFLNKSKKTKTNFVSRKTSKLLCHMSKIHFIKHHLINIWLNLIIHQSLPYYFRAMCRLWHQDKTAALVSVYSEVFEVLTLRSHWMKQELLGSNRRPRERHHQQLFTYSFVLYYYFYLLCSSSIMYQLSPRYCY